MPIFPYAVFQVPDEAECVIDDILIFPYAVLQVPDGAECVIDDVLIFIYAVLHVPDGAECVIDDILLFPYAVLQVPDGTECVIDEVSQREAMEADGEVYRVLQVKAYLRAPDLRFQWYCVFNSGVSKPSLKVSKAESNYQCIVELWVANI